jgi:hypothetical protein
VFVAVFWGVTVTLVVGLTAYLVALIALSSTAERRKIIVTAEGRGV